MTTEHDTTEPTYDDFATAAAELLHGIKPEDRRKFLAAIVIAKALVESAQVIDEDEMRAIVNQRLAAGDHVPTEVLEELGLSRAKPKVQPEPISFESARRLFPKGPNSIN